MTSNVIYSTQANNVLYSLNNIHSATDRTPYCYLIGWSKHNIWYYGRRTSKNCHPIDFWKKYFTSSKYVKEFKLKHGDPDVICIRQVFTDVKKCSEWESRVLKKLNAATRHDFLNRSNGNGNFNSDNTVTVYDVTGKQLTISTVEYYDNPHMYTALTSNKACVKDADGNTYSVYLNDPRYVSGELVGIAKNTTIVTDGILCYKVGVNDPRYVSGELVGIAKNKAAYTLPDGAIKQLYTNDELVVSGIAKHVNKNKILVRDLNGNTFQVSNKDHRYVSKELISASTGYAIGKTSEGVSIRVKRGDTRFATGELVGVMKNKKVMKHKTTGDIVVLSLDEANSKKDVYEYILSGMMAAKIKETGEIVHISSKLFNDNKDTYEALTTGQTIVKDVAGNRYRVSTDDPRIKTGELVGISHGLACMRDINGNIVKVSKDDPRIKTGELVGVCKNKKLYISSTGTKKALDPNDCRVLSGEYTLFDIKKFRKDLQNRPESIALDILAKSKNVTYPFSWRWATDIRPYTDRINSSPNNTSLITRASREDA